MHALLQVFLVVVTISGVYSIKCYTTYFSASGEYRITADDTATNSKLCPNGATCACTSYRVQCPDNIINSCTSTENQTKVTKWAYGFTTSQVCVQLPSVSSISNVTCCVTDLCNSQGFSKAPTLIISSFLVWILVLILII